MYSFFDTFSRSIHAEFDLKRQKLITSDMSSKVRKHIYLSKEVVEAAKQRGLSLGDYIAILHNSQRSVRVAHVASIYRSFALLEMARVPVDPAYFDLVEGVLGEEEGHIFQKKNKERVTLCPSPCGCRTSRGRHPGLSSGSHLYGLRPGQCHARRLYRSRQAPRSHSLSLEKKTNDPRQ
jgi:hypothetical protein